MSRLAERSFAGMGKNERAYSNYSVPAVHATSNKREPVGRRVGMLAAAHRSGPRKLGSGEGDNEAVGMHSEALDWWSCPVGSRMRLGA